MKFFIVKKDAVLMMIYRDMLRFIQNIIYQILYKLLIPLSLVVVRFLE